MAGTPSCMSHCCAGADVVVVGVVADAAAKVGDCVAAADAKSGADAACKIVADEKADAVGRGAGAVAISDAAGIVDAIDAAGVAAAAAAAAAATLASCWGKMGHKLWPEAMGWRVPCNKASCCLCCTASLRSFLSHLLQAAPNPRVWYRG